MQKKELNIENFVLFFNSLDNFEIGTPITSNYITYILKNMLDYFYTEYEEMDAKEVYVELYSYAKNYPSEFLEIANDKTIKTKSTIKKYIETGVLTTDANGNIVDASNITNVLGVSLEEATKYLLNPVNSGEVTKFEGKFKALNK